MEAEPSRHNRGFVLGSLFVAGVAALVYFSGVIPEGAAPAFANLPYTISRFLAALATMAIVARMAGEERRAWWLIALGSLVASSADIIYDYYDMILGVELPGPADVLTQILWLAPYGLWMAGVITFPYSKGTRAA
jgi:hypothetical protein